jgi:predicted metalloprotease
MTLAKVLRGPLAAAVLSALTLGVPASALHAASLAPGPVKQPVIEVTPSDVAASNEKIGMAYGSLVRMWTTRFRQLGERFAAPRIARYTGGVMTSCGIIMPHNAEYCPRNNTIFYDEVFVAGMAKAAANSLGTDGDMAAVGVIAHEMGHAVAIQLGHESRSSYANESTADCLAGTFARQAQRDGELEKGDMEEAFFGMSMAGDPTPETTGNRRFDAIIQARLARESHGTKEQRMQNFRTGLDGGPGACLDEFSNQ